MKRGYTFNQIRRATVAAAVIGMTMAANAHADGWVFSFTPYMWATNVGVDAMLGGKKIVDETVSVSDLLEDLDWIFQGRFEAQKGAFGGMIDAFDVDLSDEVNGLPLPQGAGQADLSSDMGMTILDVEGMFDPKGDHLGFAALAGTRILNERATIDAVLTPTGGQSMAKTYETDDWMVDALVGGRFTHYFTRHWGVQMQADASTGGTDYTWSVAPTLNYAFGSRSQFGVKAGYRRMVVDFEDNADLDAQMTLSGAWLGFRFSF